jgi:hypothetical protein
LPENSNGNLEKGKGSAGMARATYWNKGFAKFPVF